MGEKPVNRSIRKLCVLIAVLLIVQPMAAHAQGTSAITAQAAADEVKRLLTEFGVKGPLRLESLGPVTRPPSREPVLWMVTISAPKSQLYKAYIRPDGQSLGLFRGSESESFGGMSPRRLADVKTEKTVRTWMARIGTKETTRLAMLTVDEKGVGHAYFPILRNGHPFVSHSHYGYDFTFTASTQELLSFKASANPPPVISGRPMLDKDAALAALKQIWDTEIAPNAINVHHFLRVWYTLKGEPELGYYLAEGETSAKLVWLIRYMRMRDTGGAIQGGDDGMLIDAATGSRVVTKMVP